MLRHRHGVAAEIERCPPSRTVAPLSTMPRALALTGLTGPVESAYKRCAAPCSYISHPTPPHHTATMADPISPSPSVDEVCRRANDVIARLTGPPKTRTCPTLCRSAPATPLPTAPAANVSPGQPCEQRRRQLDASTCDMLVPRQQPQAYRPTPFLLQRPAAATPRPTQSPLSPMSPLASSSSPSGPASPARRLGPGATPSSCGRPSRLSFGASPRPSPLRSSDVCQGEAAAGSDNGQPQSLPVSAAATVELSNLPLGAREDDLRAAFEPLAPIVRIDVSPPAARIEFVHPDAAARAVAIYHHSWLGGQRIVVARAGASSAPPTPTPTSTPSSCASLKHSHEDDPLAETKRPRHEPVAAI